MNAPTAARETRVGRNDPCPCGSGKKYKKCCLQAPRRKSSADHGEPMRAALGAHLAGDLPLALERYRQILSLDPQLPAALWGVGRVQADLGDPEGGLTALRDACRLEPGDHDYRTALADVALRCQLPDEAMGEADRVVTKQPGNATALRVAGAARVLLGETQRAVGLLRRAVDVEGRGGGAALWLARALRRTGELAESRRLLQGLATGDGNPGLRGRAHKELGTVLAMDDDPVAAFDAWQTGGQLLAMTDEFRQCDPDRPWREIAAYRSEPCRRLRTDHRARRDPCFLVGFPRSGTTLLEHMLESHPGVTTSREQPVLSRVLENLHQGYGRDIAGALTALDDERLAVLVKRYWNAVDELIEKLPEDTIFIDKLPFNIIHLSLIERLFPGSRVIVALRDPRDVVLSCFEQNFAATDYMANFLQWDRCADFYHEVMSWWLTLRERLGLRYIELRYEDTVEDTAGTMARAFELLELSFDRDALAYRHDPAGRYARTPSFDAVRAPVHGRAVARWRNHREPIEALGDRLDGCIQAFGYGEP